MFCKSRNIHSGWRIVGRGAVIAFLLFSLTLLAVQVRPLHVRASRSTCNVDNRDEAPKQRNYEITTIETAVPAPNYVVAVEHGYKNEIAPIEQTHPSLHSSTDLFNRPPPQA